MIRRLFPHNTTDHTPKNTALEQNTNKEKTKNKKNHAENKD